MYVGALHIVHIFYKYYIVSDYLWPCSSQGAKAQADALDDKAFHSGLIDMLELLSYTISRISCEVYIMAYNI